MTAFVFEYDFFGTQISRAQEELNWFTKFESKETEYALKKISKLGKKFEVSDEEDFEEYVNKFFAIMKNWALEIRNLHNDLTNEVNKVMAYCNFQIICIAAGSIASENAKYIAKVFRVNETANKVTEDAYAYRCDYIADGIEDYFVARTDVVVK